MIEIIHDADNFYDDFSQRWIIIRSPDKELLEFVCDQLIKLGVLRRLEPYQEDGRPDAHGRASKRGWWRIGFHYPKSMMRKVK